MSGKAYMTVAEFAERMGFSKWKVYRLIKAGKLPAENWPVGTKTDYRISVAEAEAASEARRVKVPGRPTTARRQQRRERIPEYV